MTAKHYLLPIIFSLTLFGCGSSDMDDDEPMQVEEQTTTDDQSGNSDNTDNSDNSDNTDGSSSEYACGNSDHPKVGQLAILSTLAHDVAGQVLIKDNCTLEVSSFSYDGGGPSVYFYGGIDGDYDEKGFSIGNQLNGTVYDNDTFTVTLSSPAALDKMNGISVWCYDFAVSFGDGLFM